MAASTTKSRARGESESERKEMCDAARSTMIIVLLFIARSSCADGRASRVFGQMYYQELVGGMLRRY